jgi:glycosyltransferase involved in cell wall biosynthesis
MQSEVATKSRNTGAAQEPAIEELLKPIPLGGLPQRPLVSVLTANYNYAQYIGEAIESVQKQTYADWEMIICDDGSTDNSCEVVKSYMERDSRIKLVRKRNGGHASALNAACAASRGQVICFLDADDLFYPEKLERVVQAYRDHPQCGFVMHRILRADRKGRPKGYRPVLLPLPQGWCGPAIVADATLFSRVMCSALSVRREVAERIFPLREDFTKYTDDLITSLALLLTPVESLSAPLSILRVHGGNLTSRAKGSRMVYEEVLENLEKLRRAEDDLLARIDERLVQARAKRDPTYHVLVLRYITARLRREPRAADLARALLQHQQFPQQPGTLRFFWKVSAFLPAPVFRFAVRAVWSQGFLKRLLSALVAGRTVRLRLAEQQ